MKNIKRLFVFIIMFSLFIVNIKAEEKYTWACQYEYKSGNRVIILQYQITNISSETLKEGRSVETDGKKYTSVFYVKDSDYKAGKPYKYTQATGVVRDYPGRTVDWNLNANSNEITSAFLKKTYVGQKVVCPTLYMDTKCGEGPFKVTYAASQEDNSGITSYNCNNDSITNVNKFCINSKNQTVSCDTIMKDEYSSGNDGKPMDCTYQTEATNKNWKTFRLIYDPKTEKLTFNNNGGTLYGYLYEEDKLKETFKNAYKSGNCPSNVSCNHPWGSSVVHIGPSTSASYSGSTGSGKYDKKCGVAIGNNGQVVDPDKYASELLLNGTDLDISDQKLSCKEMLGDNLYKVLHMFVTALRIGAAIIAIVLSMLTLIPAITSDDAGALKKAITKCIYVFVVMIAVELLPTIVGVVGNIAGFDLTCL